jgi:putative resolvase
MYTAPIGTDTLQPWVKAGKIKKCIKRPPGGQRCHRKIGRNRSTNPIQKMAGNVRGAVYLRVSSEHQVDDYKRQRIHMSDRFPMHLVFGDIGSGLNYKRPGLMRLLQQVQQGNIDEVVVTHKDRLARFGTELIEWIINQAGAKLTILEQDNRTVNTEVVHDLMSIVHTFTCTAHDVSRCERNPDKGSGIRRNRSTEAHNTFPSGSHRNHGITNHPRVYVWLCVFCVLIALSWWLHHWASIQYGHVVERCQPNMT